MLRRQRSASVNTCRSWSSHSQENYLYFLPRIVNLKETQLLIDEIGWCYFQRLLNIEKSGEQDYAHPSEWSVSKNHVLYPVGLCGDLLSVHTDLGRNLLLLVNFYMRKDHCTSTFSRLSYLTHYQMTSFGLFQTERVCRRQFQIWRKWQKVILTGRKHCGKRRNCSLRAISPFPTVFSKALFPWGVKRCHCVGMG